MFSCTNVCHNSSKPIFWVTNGTNQFYPRHSPTTLYFTHCFTIQVSPEIDYVDRIDPTDRNIFPDDELIEMGQLKLESLTQPQVMRLIESYPVGKSLRFLIGRSKSKLHKISFLYNYSFSFQILLKLRSIIVQPLWINSYTSISFSYWCSEYTKFFAWKSIIQNKWTTSVANWCLHNYIFWKLTLLSNCS